MILELLKVRSHTARRNAKQRLATFANGLLRQLLEIDNLIINNFVKVKLCNRSRRLQPFASCQLRHSLVTLCHGAVSLCVVLCVNAPYTIMGTNF